MTQSLDDRLLAAGVPGGTEPVEAWRLLRRAEGPRATVLDLYELVARRRGLEPHELPLGERRTLGRGIMPDVWAGFTLTSGSERADDLIEIVEYDARWPARFEEWRARLTDRLGDAALRIDHVGSTSVAGLPAKPIIDVQVSVADLADESSYVPQVEAAGAQLRSRDHLHRYFRPFPDRPRDVHVHVCAAGSVWEHEHLLFRDYLRASPDARRRYASAKREAVARWADDGMAYTDAKASVILALLDAAASWSAERDDAHRSPDDPSS